MHVVKWERLSHVRYTMIKRALRRTKKLAPPLPSKSRGVEDGALAHKLEGTALRAERLKMRKLDVYYFLIPVVMGVVGTVSGRIARQAASGQPASERSRLRSPIPNAAVQLHASGATDDIFAALHGLRLNRENCSALLSQVNDSELHLLLGRLGGEFWENSVNRLPFARAAFHELATTSNSVSAAHKACKLFDVPSIHRPVAALLVRVSAVAAFACKPPEESALVAMLASVGPGVGIAILEAYADSHQDCRVSVIHEILLDIVNRTGWPESVELRTRLAELAVSYAEGSDVAEIQRLVASAAEGGKINPSHSTILGRLMSSDQRLAFQLLSAWAGEDPAKAAQIAFETRLNPNTLQKAAARMEASVREHFLSACSEQLWGRSPLQAEAFAEVFPPDSLSKQAKAALAANLLPLGQDVLKGWIGELVPEAKSEVLSNAFSAWESSGRMRLSPEVAKTWLDLCRGLPNLNKDHVLLAGCLAARIAKLSTLEQYVSLVSETDKPSVATAIYESASLFLAKHDPAGLRNQVQDASPEIKNRLLPNSVAVLATVDHQAAMEWLNSTDDSQTRAALEYGLIGFGSAEMPISARRELCLKRLREGGNLDVLEPAVERLSQDYASSDPSEGIRILEALPESDTKSRLVSSFVKTWAEVDAVSASEWLVELQPGRVRDLAVKELVLASRDDPEMAIGNVVAIADRTLRVAAAQSLVDGWRNLNPAWILGLLREANFAQSELDQVTKGLSEAR